MGKRGEKRRSDTFRAKVRQMLAAGYSVARIVKETGKSKAYVDLIVGQEKAEQVEAGGCAPPVFVGSKVPHG